MPEPADTPALPQGDEERPLPVVTEARPIERPAPVPLPVVAAVGTMGFVAGALAWTLLRVLRRPAGSSLVRSLRRRRARGVEIAGTRSFLVDVHLLKR
jgi:hypothetical protein